MKLVLHRKDFTDKTTIGELWIDGAFQCFTLEDVVRPVKIPGQTAIPYGEYQVVLSHSLRFGRMLPQLLNVPNFTGIRIHSGNKAEDTEGCILVGGTKSVDWISDSTVALRALMAKLEAATTPITIEIVRG